MREDSTLGFTPKPSSFQNKCSNLFFLHHLFCRLHFGNFGIQHVLIIKYENIGMIDSLPCQVVRAPPGFEHIEYDTI